MKIRHDEVMVVNGRLSQVGFSFRTKRKFGDIRSKKTRRVAVFRCDCGKAIVTIVVGVKNGNTKSCGCVGKELITSLGKKCAKHHANTLHEKEYRSWKAMRSRCSNKKLKGWKDYGGRGISVCERWDDFTLFLIDLGKRPEGTSIERIDNNGNYEPGNCKWATPQEQSVNKRNSRLIEIDGETKTLRQWSEISGIKPATILTRLSRPHIWTARDSVFAPVRKMKR